MNKPDITRRQFIKNTALLAGTTFLSSCTTKPSAKAPTPTAVDQVALGQTGLKLSRLGIGTGSAGGRIIRDLGQEEANRLFRYAYDQGITYIDTSETYRTHTIIAEAIKGLPREKLFILTKMPRIPEKPLEVLDRYRSELGVDYIDCLLMHCMIEADWDQNHKRIMDAFEEAKARKIIRSHGVSCHSLGALAKSAQLDWVDVNLVRVNPQAVCIDTPDGKWMSESNKKDLPVVLKQIQLMRQNRHGVIGMKLIGNGEFTDPQEREKSIRFVMQSGLVDAVTIGLKNTSEIDEAIMRINQALKEIA